MKQLSIVNCQLSIDKLLFSLLIFVLTLIFYIRFKIVFYFPVKSIVT